MLVFKNLCAEYSGVEKLHGISAELSPGKLVALIGPNGCGKSTLLKCAVGLLKPSQGEILLGGDNIHGISEKDRAKRISYMPQSRIAPDVSVKQLVIHGRYPHLKWRQRPGKKDEEIVTAAIRRTGLSEYVNQPVSHLSGGERQRAYLAMMLAQEAPVMLLDEPTAYLDLSSQYALMALLQQLRNDGCCIAVVLHDLALALEYADEILVMQQGRLAANGKPETVYRSGIIQQVFDVNIQKNQEQKYIFYAKQQEATP